MIEFKLPSLGADMDEGTLIAWKVAPGDAVARGQVIAVFDTTKAAVDVESWEEGVVQELLLEPGDTVPVGTVIARLLAAGEAAGAAPAEPAPAEPAPAEPAPAAPTRAEPPPARAKISPAARRRARELGVAAESLSGTGPGGAVSLADVERAAAKPQAAAPEGRAAAMRQTIAAAMSRSKREIPHYYLAEPIPLQRAVDWLAAFNAERPVTERVLMAVVLLKAVAKALERVPELNGHYGEGGFMPSAAVHTGVAIRLRRGGLIAPALHDVGSKGLPTLMAEFSDLVSRTRAGSLRSSELSEATITVTNLGEQSVERVYGVIYPPQVALIGFGGIAMRPWAAEDGTLAAVPVISATLAADHRVSDGHRGALFLTELRETLQQPEVLEP